MVIRRHGAPLAEQLRSASASGNTAEVRRLLASGALVRIYGWGGGGARRWVAGKEVGCGPSALCFPAGPALSGMSVLSSGLSVPDSTSSWASLRASNEAMALAALAKNKALKTQLAQIHADIEVLREAKKGKELRTSAKPVFGLRRHVHDYMYVALTRGGKYERKLTYS